MSTMLGALQKRRSPTALPTILVVDAGVTFGLSLNKSLREYGYDVRLATSADHAVRSVHARRFDFMIVHDEGQGRGRGAVFAVRGVLPMMPCAVVTSDPVPAGEQEVIAHAGPVAVIGKPMDLMKLIAEIERALKAVAEPITCTIAEGDHPTRKDLPVVLPTEGPLARRDSDSVAAGDSPPERRPVEDRPTRQQARALTPSRRVPAAMEDPPELVRASRPTVKLRALDAGVYSIVHRRGEAVEPIPAH